MKKFRVKVNGKVYEVEVEEIGGTSEVSSKPVQETPKVQSTSQAKPVSTSTPKKVDTPKPKPKPKAQGEGEEIKAPMPGKILEIRVKEGDSVNEGDVLLILEAMKMENEIMAPVSGVVKGIYVSTGQMVDTDDLLIILG